MRSQAAATRLRREGEILDGKIEQISLHQSEKGTLPSHGRTRVQSVPGMLIMPLKKNPEVLHALLDIY